MKKHTGKEKIFRQLVTDAGYKSLKHFSETTGINDSNIRTNLNDKFRPQVDRLFIYANALGVRVETLLNLFYPEEMEKNCKIVMENPYKLFRKSEELNGEVRNE